jgi:hypothetical protein
MPRGRALIDWWRDRLPEGERAVFNQLIQHPNAGMSSDIITERTGYKRSTRDAYLQRLRTRGLVTKNGSMNHLATELIHALQGLREP